jgi:hypothetical protein
VKTALRLPLGSDAIQVIEQADLKRSEELERWRGLSLSTDFQSEDHTAADAPLERPAASPFLTLRSTQ